MKTIIVDGKQYIMVDEEKDDSCTGCAFYPKCCDARFDGVGCGTGNFILKEVTEKKSKNNKISFYRYHRPKDVKTGFAKSNMGVTLFVKINYKRRTLRVSASVCNGDNFSKERGKIQARTRYDFGRYLEFNLNEYVHSQESVLDYLRITLDDECHLPEFEAAVKQLRRMYAK